MIVGAFEKRMILILFHPNNTYIMHYCVLNMTVVELRVIGVFFYVPLY